LDMRLVRLVFSMVLEMVALPIIIFESGWSLRIRDFVSQFGYIMFFAILGTIISIVVTASLLLATGTFDGVLSWRLALAYASLISSVDPVSTLATFGHLNVDPLLFILVFGESQINDAVAITMFRSLNKHALGSWWKFMLDMAYVFGGSVFVGMFLAIFIILCFRFGRIGQSPAHAILVIFLGAFFTFCVGELLEFSGIIAVLFHSILMGSYAGAHLNNESMALASFLLKQMSSLADMLIFTFSGVMGVQVVIKQGTGLTLGLTLCGICIIARFAAIFPLGLMSNLIKRRIGRHLPKEHDHLISWKHMLMMWHSGLRGGVSLVLVMELGPWVDPGTKTELVNATFIVVVVFLLVFGGTTGPLLKLLGVPVGDQVPEGVTLYSESDKQGIPWRIMQCVRENIMLPVLVGSRVSTSAEEDDDSGDPTGGMLSEVLETAKQAERRPGFGEDVPGGQVERMVSTVMRTATKSKMFDLFGSMDPSHVNTKGDILCDLRRANSRALRQDAMLVDHDVSDSSPSSSGDLDQDLDLDNLDTVPEQTSLK